MHARVNWCTTGKNKMLKKAGNDNQCYYDYD